MRGEDAQIRLRVSLLAAPVAQLVAVELVVDEARADLAYFGAAHCLCCPCWRTGFGHRAGLAEYQRRDSVLAHAMALARGVQQALALRFD